MVDRMRFRELHLPGAHSRSRHRHRTRRHFPTRHQPLHRYSHMANDNHRSDRVAEAIREEVATFLANDAKDPRIQGLVTVTGVDLTRDLRHARVYVSVLGSDSERAATFDGLDSIATHLRSRVGRALRLRLAPEIVFRQDDSIAHAARIESLLSSIRTDEAAASHPDDEGGEADADGHTPAGGGDRDTGGNGEDGSSVG